MTTRNLLKCGRETPIQPIFSKLAGILAIGERCTGGDANITLPTTAVDHRRSVHDLKFKPGVHSPLPRRVIRTGSVDVLFVGDILQLPPVNGAPVFDKMSCCTKAGLHDIDKYLAGHCRL